jgi:hypothetical protein
VQPAQEITDERVRHSAITSHAIGVPELSTLLDHVNANSDYDAYRRAVLEDNVLGLATANGRLWRFKTLRRVYLFRPDSLLFRALRDLWPDEEAARPLLACLCALAMDTVFRATAHYVLTLGPGTQVATIDFGKPVEETFPGVYAASTMRTIESKAYASWAQTGHLGPPSKGARPRIRALACPANLAYALMLGYLQGVRGEALFETIWAQVLDAPRRQMYDLAFGASQKGLIDFRHAGGVVEVSFRELLRPLKKQPT